MEYGRLFVEGEENIVGKNTFKTIEGVLNWTPTHYTYEYCDGGKNDEEVVIAVLENGNTVSLERESEHSHASNHHPTTKNTCHAIKKQLNEINHNIVGLIAKSRYSCSWEDDDFPEDDGIYIPLQPIDWTTVRRRLEDRLRKDEVGMKKAAFLLGIKLY